MNMRAMIVVVAGLAVTAGAFGQPGEGRRGGRGGGEFWQQIGRQMRGDPLRVRDVERAAELVGMTEDQRAAAKTLLEGYEQQLRSMREEQQAQREEAMEAMRDSGDTSGFQAMRDAQAKQREKQSQLETQLLGDMKALLKPEQAEKWAGVEASIRRDQRLRRGLMSGERLNVRDIVHDMKLEGDAASAAEGILQQYDVEIDRQLVARDQLMDQPMPEFRGLQDPDAMEAMQKRMTERREASVKVRDVNKRFAAQVEGVLPDGQREAFKARVQEGTYPEVFRRTSGGEAIAKAMAMPDLSPEQMEQVVKIEEEYKAKLGSWQPKAVKAWDEMETQMTPDRMMGGGARDAMRPLGDLRGERRELDRTTLDALKKVLTEDQAKELPELEREEGGGGGGRRRAPRDV
jgi:hypothetical protein